VVRMKNVIRMRVKAKKARLSQQSLERRGKPKDRDEIASIKSEFNRLGEDFKALKICMVKQAVAKKGGKINRAALLEEKRAGAVASRPGESAKEKGTENDDYSSEREAAGYFSKRDRQIKKSLENRERGPGKERYTGTVSK
jgi:hypothetical protein